MDLSNSFAVSLTLAMSLCELLHVDFSPELLGELLAVLLAVPSELSKDLLLVGSVGVRSMLSTDAPVPLSV
jgi:hypothetical protein